MRKRWLRRLAGCIAIEAALAASACAGGFRAGVASVGGVRALALQDAKGNRAVLAQADFPIAQSLADFTAAQILRDYGLDRSGVLLRWSGLGNEPARSEDVVAAIAASLGKLEAANVRYGRGTLSIANRTGACVASVGRDGGLRFDGCIPGEAVVGTIRAAFQMAEPVHGLERRGELVHAFPVQAIALGGQVRVLALSGAASVPDGIDVRGLIFAQYANDATLAPLDERTRAAIESVLARVK
jgi:hypothetical protein